MLIEKENIREKYVIYELRYNDISYLYVKVLFFPFYEHI